MTTFLLKNIGELATLAPLAKAQKVAGISEKDLDRQRNAWLAVKDGKVCDAGSGAVPQTYASFPTTDAQGALVIPGLVDCHTHPIFGGSRAHEFTRRLAGATYAEIAAQGGGIKFTLNQTRAASEEELTQTAARRLQNFLRNGVTTVEVKSGYGLSVKDELRLLRILNKIKKASPQEINVTCLALHAVPTEFPSVTAFVKEMTEELLPQVASERLATSVDAFIETGYFSVEDAEPFMTKAKELGFAIRVHADEFSDAGAAAAAARWGARSADHLECTPPAAIKEMAAKKVVAVLLPGTSIYTKIPYAKAQPFINAGCPVALATDFNPGSCRVENLAFIATLGALHCQLNLAQTLAAVTYVPAFSLNLHHKKGALAPGFDADFLLYKHPTLDDWLADLGQLRPHEVYVRGISV